MPMRVDVAEIDLTFGLTAFVGERLGVQLDRAATPQAREELICRLQMAFEQAIGDLIDRDLLSPTPEQIERAIQVARARLVSIPGEAFRYRGTMELFLARHPSKTEPD